MEKLKENKLLKELKEIKKKEMKNKKYNNEMDSKEYYILKELHLL